jgi:hypothetical protein
MDGASLEEEQQPGEVVAFAVGIKTLATGVNEQDRFSSIGGFQGGQWSNRQRDSLHTASHLIAHTLVEPTTDGDERASGEESVEKPGSIE